MNTAVAESAAPTACITVSLPRINTHVPGKGLFRGVMPGIDGGADYKLFEQVNHLEDGNWNVCTKAATDLNDEGQTDWSLPTPPEAALLYAMAKADHDGWYWTGEQYASDPDAAWVQGFYYGRQLTLWKLSSYRARAVRREPLQ